MLAMQAIFQRPNATTSTFQAGERSSARVLMLTNKFDLAGLLVAEGLAQQAIPPLTSIRDETVGPA
jgi:hypothetical protein